MGVESLKVPLPDIGYARATTLIVFPAYGSTLSVFVKILFSESKVNYPTS